MPFSYAIDAKKQLATGTFSGSVEGAEIASVFRAVYTDVAWQPGFDTLWDCTGITQLLLGPADLASIVAVHREFSSVAGTGLEIIVVSRSLDHVMAKIYSVMMKNQARRVRVCQSVAEAAGILERRT
jgi:hypothetical protein